MKTMTNYTATYFRQCKSRNSLGTNAFSSVVPLSVRSEAGGWSERASTWSVRGGSNINNVPLSWPDSFFCLVAEERRGEERRGAHSLAQTETAREGRQGGRRRGREGSIAVLHCKLCAPHKGLVIVRPPPLLLLSPTLLQWDKG